MLTFLLVLLVLVFLAGVVVLTGLRMVVVHEATAIAFKRLGRFAYCAMELAGYSFNPDGFIVKASGPRGYGSMMFILRIGGWVFYIKWFVEPALYSQYNDKDGFGEGIKVALNQIQRDLTAVKAETSNELPLDVKVAWKMTVVNPYLFLFVAPKDVIARVTEIVESIVQAWIRANTYEAVQAVSSNGGGLWVKFGDETKRQIDKIKTDWGIEIINTSIVMMSVGLQAEDQQALAEKKRQQLKTAAGAQEIMGGMLEIAAMKLGLENGGEAREALATTDEGKALLQAMAERAELVVVQRALGIKPVLFGNADGSSLDPLLTSLLALVSALKGGAASQSPSDRSGDKAPRGIRSGGDDDILQQDPSRLSPEDLERYNEAVIARKERRNRRD